MLYGIGFFYHNAEAAKMPPRLYKQHKICADNNYCMDFLKKCDIIKIMRKI